MRLFIAADHRGFELKDKLIDYLHEKEYRIEDLGAYEYNPSTGVARVTLSGLKVYPNPARGAFRIESSRPLGEIALYRPDGACVKLQASLVDYQDVIYTEGLAPGLYLLHAAGTRVWVELR